ncbi:tetratricopeptide repeat protein [Limnofasciculus baicalensis]|uniref:Tetratricopeptide repeat protein n=1 Tax=Limnofasciculus baicalensis BBK-W-15 TaxID=2699891 RepID=A0AAE3KQ12_9CYAN|nr:tetratricopeptide repeat protein [Limnofasciculus baicalensis]MCP2731954.1 tetratricopeptide repeat protein [Limnofasciculus baicalensis BBK-W-15]
MLALTNSNDFDAIQPDYHQLPIPTLDLSDQSFNAILNASAIPEPIKRVVNLQIVVDQFPTSVEGKLRLANSLIDISDYDEAEQILTEVEKKDPWDWRVLWYKGRSLMAQKKGKEAQAAFDQVYFDLPGELAPKLALGLAAELAGNSQLAIKMYDLVSRTDPSYTTAAFGLARCLSHSGNRKAAVAALERVPQTSSLFTRSRVEVARTLINIQHSPPGTTELQEASSAIETLTLEGMDCYRLAKQVLETTLNLVTSKTVSPVSSIKILGQPMEELHLRQGLEKALRDMAHLVTGEEKIRLVDEANRVRPRTLL